MKKTIITLILILAGVYILLSVLSIGDEYTAEKLLYRAAKINEKIAINPDVAPPKMLTMVEDTLEKVIEKYPASNAAKTAHLALAEFYIAHKKYDKAVSILNTVINKADKGDVLLLSKVYFLKGNAYEIQNQWDKALREYTILRDKYTNTLLGLQVPLYIGVHYIRKGQEEEAKRAFREAAAFYEKIEKDNKKTILGYKAACLLRDTHLGMKENEKAGEVVKNIIDEYPSQMTLAEQLPYVELIYVGALKTPESAIEIYRSIEEKTKDKRLKEILNKKIDVLKGKKAGKTLSK